MRLDGRARATQTSSRELKSENEGLKQRHAELLQLADEADKVHPRRCRRCRQRAPPCFYARAGEERHPGRTLHQGARAHSCDARVCTQCVRACVRRRLRAQFLSVLNTKKSKLRQLEDANRQRAWPHSARSPAAQRSGRWRSGGARARAGEPSQGHCAPGRRRGRRRSSCGRRCGDGGALDLANFTRARAHRRVASLCVLSVCRSQSVSRLALRTQQPRTAMWR